MTTKANQPKPRTKQPKPNLYGPNSPSPKKKVTNSQHNQDEESEDRLYANTLKSSVN